MAPMSTTDRTATVNAGTAARACRLTLLTGEDAGLVVDLSARSSVTIGRGEHADVRIDDGSLSRVHARVQGTPAGVVIMDLESHNGTFVNDDRVHQRLLVNGDRVRLAAVEWSFDDR